MRTVPPQFNESAHQSKIYGKSNRRDFSLIFAELISMQTLAIYPSSIVVSRARDLSRDGQENGQEKRTTGREMWFLLRLTFWLGLVLVLLPRDKTPESEKLPQIGASEAVQAATAAVSDMSQFCKRQPATCEVGGQAATVIGQRAAEGARKVYSIITDKTEKTDTTDKADKTDKTDKPDKPVKKTPGAERSDKKAPDHTGAIGNVADAQEAMIVDAPRDTLTADDLALEWRVPAN
jgi:hypothetical protein